MFSLNPTRALRAASALTLLVFAACAIYPTWPGLLAAWRDTTDYSHGYLIAAAVLAATVLRAGNLPAASPQLKPLPGALLLAAICLWLIAYRASSAIGQQLLAPAVLWLTVWFALGRNTAIRLGMPLAWLYFAIPLWDLLVPSLQQATVWACGSVLDRFGVPVKIDEFTISIPEGTFQVAEGCAGKRYFIVAVATSALLSTVLSMSARRALAYVAATALLALVTNWVRVIVIVIAGHTSQMRHYLVAREHTSLGWAMFAVLLALVSVLGLRLARTAAPRPDRRPTIVEAQTLATLAPSLRAAPPALAMLCLPLLAIHYDTRAESETRSASPPISLGPVPGWNGPTPASGDWNPQFPGASAQVHVAFGHGGKRIEVFVARYERQQQDRKLVSYRSSVAGPNWTHGAASSLAGDTSPWRLATNAVGAESDPLGAAAMIRASAPSEKPWIISYVYDVDGVLTPWAPLAQFAYGLRSWFHPAPSLIVAAAAPCEDSCQAARDLLREFWMASGTQLLPGSGAK